MPDAEMKSGRLICRRLRFDVSTPEQRKALNPLRFALAFSTIVALIAFAMDISVVFLLNAFGLIDTLTNALWVGSVLSLSISFTISFLLAYANAHQVKSLSVSHEYYEYLSHTDGLTGLRNRAGLCAGAKRLGKHYVVAFFDIDHFKSINDSYGHAAGDAVISDVAKQIVEAFPASSLVGRLGGEEFVVAVSNMALPVFMTHCENCRSAVQEHAFVADGVSIHVTVSIGVSTPMENEDFDTVMHRADVALYKAKGAGRNRMIVDEEQSLTA